MRLKITMFLFMTAATAALGQKSPPDFQTGAGIQKACSTALDLNVYHPRKVKRHREAFELGLCLGLVKGVYENLEAEE
jgi:hypothetical protein